MLKAVSKLNAKIVDSKTGKPIKLAKKGTTTRTIENTEAHLANLKLEAKLNIGKHIATNYSVGDWKTFNRQYKVVPRSTEDSNSASASSETDNESSESNENTSNSADNASESSGSDNQPKSGAWA